jgi:hypothetical protein
MSAQAQPDPGQSSPPPAPPNTPPINDPYAAQQNPPAPSPQAGKFDQILSFLGGGPKKVYSVDPQSGKAVATDAPYSRRDAIMATLAGALTGLVGGSQVHGPGAGLRSFGAGAGAEIQQQQEAAQQGKQQASQDFERQRQLTRDQQDQQLKQAQIFEANQHAVLTSRQAFGLGEDAEQKLIDNDAEAYKAYQTVQDAGGRAILRELNEDQVMQEHSQPGARHATTNNYLRIGRVPVNDPKTGLPAKDENGNPVMQFKLAEVDPDAAITLPASEIDKAVATGYPVAAHTPGGPDVSIRGVDAIRLIQHNAAVSNFGHLIGNINDALGLKGANALDSQAMMQSNPGLGQAVTKLSSYWDGQPSTLGKALQSMQAPDAKGMTPNAPYAKTIINALGGDRLDDFNAKVAGKAKAEEALPGEEQKAVLAEGAANRNAARAESRQAARDAEKDARTYGAALDPNTGERVHTTLADSQAHGLTDFTPMGAGEVQKERDRVNQWNDVQTNVSRYRAAATQASQKPLSANDYVNLHSLLNKAGALDLGVSGVKLDIPMVSGIAEGLSREVNSEAYHALSAPAQALYDGYIRSMAAVPAYQKALAGIGRSNKETLDLELAAIPNPTMKPQDIARKLNQFQENIDIGSQGMIRFPGMTTPKEIRQKYEGAPQQTVQPQQTDATDPFAQFGGKAR